MNKWGEIHQYFRVRVSFKGFLFLYEIIHLIEKAIAIISVN